MPNMRSLNNTRQVQSDYLKRVERLCGISLSEEVNHMINRYVMSSGKLPKEIIRSHYRSLASGINKPVKYMNNKKRI